MDPYEKGYNDAISHLGLEKTAFLGAVRAGIGLAGRVAKGARPMVQKAIRAFKKPGTTGVKNFATSPPSFTQQAFGVDNVWNARGARKAILNTAMGSNNAGKIYHGASSVIG
jgi:hypothetical protein